MKQKAKEFLDENLYKSIDELNESSLKYKDLSKNLKDKLSDLFDSIDDEGCHQILSDIDELNTFLLDLNNLSTNEFATIKNNGLKLIDKYIKHKDKINTLKTKNNQLKEELTNTNEEKEKLSLKIDELNEEVFKLYQEKKEIDNQISLKIKNETEKQKLDNEYLKDKIEEYKESIEILNIQINQYEQERTDLMKQNDEIYKINTQLKEEILCKDNILKISTEKYCKLNDENDKIKSMNRGLQKTIEALDNKNQQYQILVKQLVDKGNKHENQKVERKISSVSIRTNEDNDILNNPSETESIHKSSKRRYGVDYSGKGINLNELLIDESDSSDNSKEKIVKCNSLNPNKNSNVNSLDNIYDLLFKTLDS